MPTVSSKLQHNLGRQEALSRLKANCAWAHSISDLKETWTGNVMEFVTSVQGVKISGTIEVTDDQLLFQGKVPLIALPFKSWIPNILQNALKVRPAVVVPDTDGPQQPVLYYLHIPKAGGTTLGEFIYNQCRTPGERDEGLIRNGVFFTPDGFFRENGQDLPAQMQTVLQRKDIRAVMGHFAFGVHRYADRPFQYITQLRDPVKRVISLYHYLKLADTMSLEAFARNCPYPEVDNDQTRRIAGTNPPPGECSADDFNLAKENLEQHFTVVGQTERFDETLALLQLRLHWKKEFPAYPRNVNMEKAGTPVSAAEREAIQDRNRWDMELYAYAGKLMDRMIAEQPDRFRELLDRQRLLNAEGATA